jgi:hypothetical protein
MLEHELAKRREIAIKESRNVAQARTPLRRNTPQSPAHMLFREAVYRSPRPNRYRTFNSATHQSMRS